MQSVKMLVGTKEAITLVMLFVILGIIFPIFCPERYVINFAFYVLLYTSLALAWNVLGGYVGYINFGSCCFFGVGAYLAAFLIENGISDIWMHIIAGSLCSGLLGLFLGAITLRVRGIYFAISTLALSVVMQMIIINTPQLGGALGMFLVKPHAPAPYPNFTAYLFSWLFGVTLILVIITIYIERSHIGKQLIAMRDDEVAAECIGIPTLKLKLLAAFISCAFMGAVGGVYPYYIAYLEPYTTFSLEFTINPIAMSIIGGTQSWLGPIVGGIVLSSFQQYLCTTISSTLSLLLTGIIIMGIVIFVPDGIIVWLRKRGIPWKRHY